MLNKFLQFMYGRRGTDELNVFILIVMFILAFINIFFRSYVVYILQSTCFIIFIIRFLSKNIAARDKENNWFLKVKSKFSKKNNDYNTVNYNDYQPKKQNEIKYKYFKCPNCEAKLRVPKGKGKSTITCPRCRTSFKGKS